MDIHENIFEWMSMKHKYPQIDIQVCMDIQLDVHGFLWISMHDIAVDSRSRDTKAQFTFDHRRKDTMFDL